MVMFRPDADPYDHFIECLRMATQNIERLYMYLPIAGSALPIYRERVYCYELYHQLRLSWGEYHGYSLGGEVDKTHHPLMVGPDISNSKPDLLIHRPGDMDGNLIIVEVKPVVCASLGIRKDLRTLTGFIIRGRYQHAIYLIYGDNLPAFNSFIACARRYQANDVDGRIDLESISLFWHRRPGQAADRIEWNN